MIKNCYIRVDANSKIGTGHLVRTEILADKLVGKDINTIFLCNTIPKDYKLKLINKGYKVEKILNNKSELEQTLKIISKTDNNLLIIDSDNQEFYTKKFQTEIRNNRNKIMMITFYNKTHFYADIVLNQNIMAASQTYSCENYTIKLLGPKYVILKDEYQELASKIDKIKNSSEKKTVLLTFGGVDKPNRTEIIYKTLLDIENKPDKIIIILGALYRHKEHIEQLAKKPEVETEIYQNTPQMPYLLAESDIVFSSGGLTVWEAGILKSLSAIIGYTERERIGGKYLDDNQLAIYLGDFENIDLSTLSSKIETLLKQDNTRIINKLYSEIDVNGIYNVIDIICKI